MADAPDRIPAATSERAIQTARRCADALLEALGGGEEASRLWEELQCLEAMHEELAAFEELMISENATPERRQELIATLFKDRAQRSQSVHSRLTLLRSIAGEFQAAMEWRRHSVQVKLTTAVPLDPEQTRDVTDQLRSAVGAHIALTTAVDPQIVGGAVVEIGDRVFDASVAARLRRVREELAMRLSGQERSLPPEKTQG